MTSIWLIVLSAFLIQEVAFIAPALVVAQAASFSLWSLSMLWVLVTAFDIAVGYFFGKWIQKHLQGWKFQTFLRKKVEDINNTMGDRGKNVFLFLFGIFYYPYLVGFFASWFDISFSNTLIYVLLGDCLWFVVNIFIAYGIFQFTSNTNLSIIISIASSLSIATVLYYFRGRIFKN